MPSNLSPQGTTLDRAGMVLSALCLAHCMILPVLVVALPFFLVSSLPGWLVDTDWFHAVLVVPVVLVSAPVLTIASKKIWWFGPAAALAFSSLISALFVHQKLLEISLTVFGAALLFWLHAVNLKRRATA